MGLYVPAVPRSVRGGPALDNVLGVSGGAGGDAAEGAPGQVEVGVAGVLPDVEGGRAGGGEVRGVGDGVGGVLDADAAGGDGVGFEGAGAEEVVG